MPPLPRLTRGEGIAAAVLAAACAVSRFAAVSRSAWDWDEMLFCLAMRSYDVARHHPHPPGFPLFIALGRAACLVAGDDFRALQAVSVIASMLLFPAMFLLARELRFRAETAMAAAALCAFFPNVWFFGGTAFSDVASLTLVVFAAALLLRGCRDARAYVAGALLLAAAAAIRPQNLLIGFFPAVVATFWRARASWRSVALAVGGGAAVLAAAYGFAVRATGGWSRYIDAVRVHGAYITSTDSFRSLSRPPLWRLFDDFFVKNYQSPAFGLITTLFVAASLAAAVRRRDRRVGALLLTFGPFAILAWLMLDRFSISRFSIGYCPLFAILAAHGMETVAGGRRLAQCAAAMALTAGFIVYTWPALAIVRRGLSPPVMAAQAVRAIPPPYQLYVARSMKPFADYFLPAERTIEVRDEHALPLGSAGATPWLLSDFSSATPPRGFVFRRAHARLWNIARRDYFDVALFRVDALPQFLSGWYPPERLGENEWRWTSARAVLALPPSAAPSTLVLELDVPDATRPPSITFTLNGVVIDRFTPGAGRVTREYRVTPAAGRNLLEIAVNPTYNALREKTGDDNRELGILVRGVSWGGE